MPILITPRLLEQRSDLYHQIGSMISAGLRLHEAVQTLARNPPARSFRKPLERLLAQLDQGETFTGAMAATGGWMPIFDLSLLEAGEKSGRLDQCLQLLSNYYRQQAVLVKSVLGSVAYPILVLHVAVILFPITLFTGLILKGDVFPFLLSKLEFFVPVYGGIFLFLYACQGARRESWRVAVERLLRLIPVLGSALRKVALARLAAALDALMAAGVPIFDAWELAASASGSPQIKQAVLAWRPEVESGVTPSEAVRESGVFPDVFTSLYHTAEISGQQEDALRRMHKYYYEEGMAGLKAVSTWGPRLLYLGVVAYAAVQIVGFYTKYFSAMGGL
jgi:type IV pilus assembly protein PilC